MFAVDTNVLVYAADADCPEHARCRGLLQSWRLQSLPWYSTWSIVYEFLRVATHPRVMRRPLKLVDAWRFIEAVRASPSFELLIATPRHGEVAGATFHEHPQLAGSILHDLHTAVLMREHGIRRIYTRDADFHRFPFVEVIDPLQP